MEIYSGVDIGLALRGGSVLPLLQHRRLRSFFAGCVPIDCRVERVHFGSALGIVIEYAVELDGRPAEPLRIFGQLPSGEAKAAYAAALDKSISRYGLQVRGGETLPIDYLPSIGMILRRRGIDERIDGLVLLRAGHAAVTDEECRIAGLAAGFQRAELLTHRLGKRAVLRLEGDGRDAPATSILKLYKRRTVAAALAAGVHAQLTLQGFDGRTGFSVPQIAPGGALPAAILMEDIQGRLVSQLSGHERGHALEEAGAGLARLHASHLEGLVPYSARDDLLLLQRWLEFASPHAPLIGSRVASRLSRLKQGLDRCRPYQPTPIHRDFHQKQLIRGRTSLTLMDFDTIRIGDPAQDIGNFIAHLRFDALASGKAGPAGEQDFMRGYLQARKNAQLPCEQNISWHVEATLLRLTMIHALSETAGDVVERMINGA